MNDTKTATIQYYGETCTLEVMTSPNKERDGRRKGSRIYFSLPWSPEEQADSTGISAVPSYSIKGEDPANDKAWKRYNKAEVAMMKNAIQRAVTQEFLDPKALEAKYSRYAGCSMCPCSPGFIWKDGTNSYTSKSIWITVKSPSKEASKERERKAFTVLKEIEVPSFSI